jgi:hypothetical protein
MPDFVFTWEFAAIVGLVVALIALFVHAATGGLRRSGGDGDTGAWGDYGGGDGD